MTLTRKELFAERLDEIGDFWRVCQEFAADGWSLGDFEGAGVVQDLYSFNYLRNMLLAPRHRNIGSFFEWLRESLKDPSVLDSEKGRKAWVNDLEDCLSTTVGNDYEIPARLTKSGNPELYTITREWFTTPDGKRDYRIIHG